MSVSLKVDMREFQATMRKAAVMSKRALPEIVNSRAFNVVKVAFNSTPIADREKIQTDLGAELKSQRVNKKGKIVRRYKYSPTKVVYAIINARRKKAGEKGLGGKELGDAAKKLIAGRLRAVGSLRSGWRGALGKLAAAAREASGAGSGPRVKSASTAEPAQSGSWSPTAKWVYRVLVGGKENPHVDPRAVDALEHGFAVELAEMKNHIENKMADAMKEAGAMK